MKLVIIGSRTVEESAKNLARLIWLMNKHYMLSTIDEVVSGECDGADRLGEYWAKAFGIEFKGFPADWYPERPDGKRVLDRGAGFKRNTPIAERGDQFLAIIDKPLEESKGTMDTLSKMVAMGKRGMVWNIKTNKMEKIIIPEVK